MKLKGRTIIWLILSVVCIVLIYLLVYYFSFLSQFFEKDNASGELFKVVLTTIGGIGALIALYYAARRVQAMEKGNVDTRFNNAVGHLGSENPTVILGAVHALHQISIKHKSYTQVIHNLFCSYLRENSAKFYEKSEYEKNCPV